MNAKEQNKLAGIFLIVHGAVQALIMVALGLVYGGIGLAMFATSRRNEEQFVGLMFVVVMAFVVLFSMIFVIPQVVGGWKMLKERPNARTWGIVGSIISCMSFPLGTAAGVFGLIFLFGDAGRAFYLGTSNAPGYSQPQPPPPNSWQG
jgi:hypothetical protein